MPAIYFAFKLYCPIFVNTSTFGRKNWGLGGVELIIQYILVDVIAVIVPDDEKNKFTEWCVTTQIL